MQVLKVDSTVAPTEFHLDTGEILVSKERVNFLLGKWIDEVEVKSLAIESVRTQLRDKNRDIDLLKGELAAYRLFVASYENINRLDLDDHEIELFRAYTNVVKARRAK